MNYFEIQYDKLSFKSAAFLLIRVVHADTRVQQGTDIVEIWNERITGHTQIRNKHRSIVANAVEDRYSALANPVET